MEKSPQALPDFPDGGLRAWSVAIGALFMSFATLGWINSFGVFQTYYEENTFKDQTSSNIAWIGSMQYAFLFAPGVFAGRLLDLGYYNGPLALSSVSYIAVVFLIAECKTYAQVVLCQGVAMGLFAGMLYCSTPAIVSHWFLRKRSRAFGVLSAGPSIGGTVFPIATQRLINSVGFKWSIRIMASIIALCVFIGNLLLRPRLQPSNEQGGLFNWSAFKNPAFTFCVIAYNVTFLGIYVPLIYLDISAQVAGLSPNFTFYLVAIANCASLVGRVGAGILADRYGALNTLIPFMVIGAITTFVWPFTTSKIAPLVVVSTIYGCATGAFVSLIPSTPARLGGMNDAGRRIGMALTSMTFGAAAGPPLAGVIRTKTGSYEDVGFYCGGMMILACILLAITRHLALGKWVGRF